MLNGDVLTDLDLTRRARLARGAGARATLALVPVEDTAATAWCPPRDDGQVRPSSRRAEGEAPTNRINAGAYVLERDVVEARSRRAAPSRSSARSSRRSRATVSTATRPAGYWIDIGDARALPRGHLGPARRPGGVEAARRATRPARWSTRARWWPARTWGRRACWAATARWAPTRAWSAPCCTTACIVGADAAVLESVLAERVRVGERARVRPRAMVGAGAVIGEDAVDRRGSAARSGGRGGAGRAAWRPPEPVPMSEPTLDRATIEAARPRRDARRRPGQPLQLGDALWRAQSAESRPATARPGSWSAAWAARRSAATWPWRRSATAPRGRSGPCAATRSSPGRRPDTLVLCASYSGDTEETLACFEAAGAAGAGRVVLTTGGPLAGAARAEGVPGDRRARRDAAARGGALHDRRRARVRGALRRRARGCTSEIDSATALLERLVEEWGPDSPEDSQAKAIARCARTARCR